MSIRFLSVSEAMALLAQGYDLIDIRPEEEYRREHIQGAKNVPIAKIKNQKLGDKVIFTCLSGNRTQADQTVLAQSATADVLILEGGLNAWKKAQGPLEVDASEPLPLMRQVQIVAGSLVWVGMLLGFFVHSFFWVVPVFVGLGLTFAGVTGWCGMAILLMKMPWNRPNSTT